jgi:hemerythrin superfamily protein
MLQTLEKMGPSAQGFEALFAEFRQAVLDHAEQEEREEFPDLKALGTAEMRVMAAAIKAAETTAPTHPHPGGNEPPRPLTRAQHCTATRRHQHPGHARRAELLT